MSRATTIEIGRAPNGGWFVASGPRLLACHSTAADLSAWLARYLAPLDAGLAPEPPTPPANDSHGGLTVLQGGRCDD